VSAHAALRALDSRTSVGGLSPGYPNLTRAAALGQGGDFGAVGPASAAALAGELLDGQKEFNTQINKIRYVIEQVIANFKTWRIMHADYRRPPATFPEPSHLWWPCTFIQPAE
jgi:hypothetical protein